jgi:hypothetical protein
MNCMKTGDRVRVIGVPAGLGDNAISTKEVLERCVGRIFSIVNVKFLEETQQQLFELEVGEVVGEPPYMHSIWIEPEFVELVGDGG